MVTSKTKKSIELLFFHYNGNMETLNAAELLAALGHDSRLSVFRLLVEAGPEGLFPTVISEHLGMPPATLSFHLSHLSRVGLIRGQKESRFIRYSAEFTVMDDLISFLTSNCCQGNACLPKTSACNTTEKRRKKTSQLERAVMGNRVFNVLFLCTGNSARSILGEALFNHLGRGRVRAFSAGSQPSGRVNPVALETLEKHGIPLPADVRSKSWDEFAAPDAPRIDYIFTVCASAAGEACPVWPGHPATAHWGIVDPAHVEPMEARREAFEKAYRSLEKRIKAFLTLDLETMSPGDVVTAARLIHEAASEGER